MPITTIYVTDPYLVAISFILGFATCWAILFFIALKNTKKRHRKGGK